MNFRGEDIAEIDDEFMLGLIKYNEQKYAEAIPLLKRAYEKDHLNYWARYLTGMSYLAEKDFSKAEPILQELSQDNAHLLQDQAKWYLGLLYLTDADPTNDGKAEAIWRLIQSEDIRKKTESLL